jgi:hypothetical protein
MHPRQSRPSPWVLAETLSNPELTTLFQRLTSADWHQAKRRRRRSYGWGDGRRPFGTVSGAIVQVLSEADSDLRVRDIKAQVEQLLGNSVSRHSVKSYLHRGCDRDPPQFTHPARGRYRVR